MRFTKLSASVTAVTLLAPFASFAAWSSPGDLARLTMPLLRQTPMDMSYEIHGNMDKYYASAWVNGQSKGFDGTTNMTIDIADGAGTLRTKLEMRMKDETLYLMIKSIDGKYEHELGSLVANVKGKKWIKMPMSSDMSAITADEEIAAALDELFMLSESTSGGITTHQLTLKRELVKGILEELRKDNLLLSGKLSKVATSTPKASATLSVRSAKNGSILGMNINAVISSPEFSLTAKGSMTPSKKAFNVVVPTDVIDAEQFLNTLDSDLFGGPFAMDNSSWEEEMDWSEDTWTDTESSDISEDCSKNISLMRKGLCNVPRTRNGR